MNTFIYLDVLVIYTAIVVMLQSTI